MKEKTIWQNINYLNNKKIFGKIIMNSSLQTLDTYTEQPWPWGNSPECIASWFWEKTTLRTIYNSFSSERNEEAISMMNSLCITLWLPHRFYKETCKEDIRAFINYLSGEYYKNDFSLRVSQILLKGLDEKTWKNLREFLERINIWKDIPSDVFLWGRWDTIKLNEEIEDIAWSLIKTFWIVGWLYQIHLFFRILGLS